jgi:predicted anti-sigma-YlaC factor YlaD
MNCEDFQQLISTEMDGELSPSDEKLLWEHLSSCETCRAWRRDQIEIRLELQRWPEEEMPAMAVPMAAQSEPPRARVYRVPRVLAWAAALLLFVQGAYVTSTLVSGPRMNGEPALMTSEDEVETIVITDKHRVSYSTTDNPLVIGKPLLDTQDNGG